MTKECKAAHLKMLAELTVRTVLGRGAPVYQNGKGGKTGGRPPAHTRDLHRRIMALKAKGYSRKQMHAELGVSLPTIGKHLNGKIKAK